MSFTSCYKGGLLYHTSDLLTACGGVRHAFTTRVGGVSEGVYQGLNLRISSDDVPARVHENYQLLAKAVDFPLERLTLPDQTHSDHVRVVTEADAGKGIIRPKDYADVDALITNTPNLPLIAYSSDCNIAVFFDPVTRSAGSCHAGWRGAANGIMGKTVAEMQRIFGVDPANLRVAVGAGINPCCFETDADVPDALYDTLGGAAERFIFPDGGKWRVDLKGVNTYWMTRAGVLPQHMDVDPACTGCHPELYWSHRKMGAKRGTQAAIIMLL